MQMLMSLLAGAILSAPPILFAETRNSPYEPYAGNIRSVMKQLDGNGADMEEVRSLMRRARSFRYAMRHPFKAAHPEVTSATHAGDCKDKALWLAQQMDDESVRYVIGRKDPSSPILHAWLTWNHDGQAWVLDCTNRRDPIPRERLRSGQYVPMYSWRK
jgi:hypothetical protein